MTHLDLGEIDSVKDLEAALKDVPDGITSVVWSGSIGVGGIFTNYETVYGALSSSVEGDYPKGKLGRWGGFRWVSK